MTLNFKLDIKINNIPDEKRIKKAQFYLDTQIFNDSEPYMPIKSGALKNMTRLESMSMAGTGKVCLAAAPYGRFQYYGKVMIDPVTGSPWARKDAKKVVTNRNLTWSNPMTHAKWFDTVKKNNMQKWKDGIKDILNGTDNL